MNIHWSIKLGIAVFILMVFGWIFFPAHTPLNDWEELLSDIGVVLTVVALIWFWLERMQIIKDRAAAEEAHLDRVRDKVIGRQELRANAEAELTNDQKVQLETNRRWDEAALKYSVNANPHYKKIDVKA